MKKALLLLVLSIGLSVLGWGQTNPTAQTLPYSQNFSSLTGVSPVYPAGIQGWTIAGSLSTSYSTAAPSGNQNIAVVNNTSTSGHVGDFIGKMGVMSTSSALKSICLAINTTGLQTISFSFDAATQRTENTRQNELGLQYRIGTSGTFTNISGSTYLNQMTPTNTTGTGAVNILNVSLTLPVACENQAVVQLRWVIRDVSGSGNRPGFSIDNISVSGLPIGPNVTTEAVTSIGTTTAIGHGTITATGGADPTTRGFCWDLATNADPDINDFKVEETPGPFALEPFSNSLTGLSPGTKYKERAFASNANGTGYGNVVTFYTLSLEPNSHAASFTASTVSNVQIDLAFSPANSISNAAGYLILQKSGSAPTGLPSDATAYTVGATVGDATVAAVISNITLVSASITGLSAGTHYYFTLVPFNWDGTNAATYNYKTDGTIPGANATTNAPLNATSEVSGPNILSQPDPLLISSLATTEAAAIKVFDMDVYDYGGDGQPTKITQVTIKASLPDNTADWSATFAGAKLSIDGGTTFVITGTPVISASSIVFPVASGNLNIPDYDVKTLSLYIYLKNSGIIDNQFLEFKVDTAASAHGFTADPTGSTFKTTFTSAPFSNAMMIDVEATKLIFSNQFFNTVINTAFGATVKATDINSNVDADITTPVTLSASAGTLSSATGLTQNLVAGVFAWTDLMSSTAAPAVIMTATPSSGPLPPVSGNTFKFLYPQPLTQASAITFSNVGLNSMTVSWTNGDGTARILVAKAGGAPGVPTDGKTYAANAAFGSGDTLSSGGQYVLYNDSGNTVDITNLQPSTVYYFKVFEFNGSAGTENYLTTGSSANQATLGQSYYSVGSVDPTVLTNWKSNRDGTGTSPASFTAGDGFVIQNGHQMTTGGTWSISGTGSKLTIENGGMLTAGHVITLNAATTFQIDNGGYYIQNVAISMGTNIFAGTEIFNAGSTFEFRIPPTGFATPAAPGWGNVIINQTASSGNIGWSGIFSTIQGNMTILSTGTGATRHALTANTNVTTAIGGNLTISGGNFWLSSGSGTNAVTIGGNLVINGGTLDIANNSGVTTTTVNGNVVVSSGILTEGGSTTTSKIIFGKNGTQTFTSGGTISNLVNFEVGSTSVTDLGTSVISGGGTFSMLAGSTLHTANTAGLNGSLTLTGTKTFDPTTNFIFDGTAEQVAGSFMPATVNNLTIENAAGVKLSNTLLTVTGTLTINSGKLLTIGPGKALTVGTMLNNLGGETSLVIGSDATGTGSLIFNGQGVAGTVQRYIAAWGDAAHGWHHLSSPMMFQMIRPEFVPNDPIGWAQDFYAWDEVNGYWFNCKDVSGQWVSGFDSYLVPGKGYLVAYQNDVVKNFSGIMDAFDANISGLTNTPGAYPPGNITSGWNLLGNPFTSAVTWGTANWNLTNVTSTAKIWEESTASYIDIPANTGIIPAMSGFMVETTGNGSLTIPATDRVHSATPWYKSTNNPYIKLVVHSYDEQTAQENIVTFDQDAAATFDPAFDSHFLSGFAPSFYTTKGAEMLSTAVFPSLENETTIPVSFVKTAASEYTIEAVTIDNLPAQVYLTDLKLDKTQNLAENPSYTFTSEEGDNPARFMLSFSHVGIGGKDEVHHAIYASGNTISMVNPGKGRLEVYNLAGQQILQQEINSNGVYRFNVHGPSGYYMVRFTTGTSVIVNKVFIKS